MWESPRPLGNPGTYGDPNKKLVKVNLELGRCTVICVLLSAHCFGWHKGFTVMSTRQSYHEVLTVFHVAIVRMYTAVRTILAARSGPAQVATPL